MKTIGRFIFVLSVLVCMSACGGSGDESNGSDVNDGNDVSDVSDGDSSTPSSELRLAVSAGGGAVAMVKTYTANYVSQTSLWTWGDNYYHQLGDLSLWSENEDFPIEIDPPVDDSGLETTWDTVAVGRFHMIGISVVTGSGERILWGWGENSTGQAGNYYLSEDVRGPSRIGSDTDWEFVAAGAWHSLAIKENGALYAWGNNQYGQLGCAVGWYSSVPAQVGLDSDWSFVSAGEYHTLAIKALPYGEESKAGSLYAWGSNSGGLCGNGESGDNISEPEFISAGWKQVSAGRFHSAGVKLDGTLWAWGGIDSTAYLGNGTNEGSATPVQVGTDSDWEMVSVGGNAYQTIALKSDGSLWAWGPDSSGTVGNGEAEEEILSPVEIQPGTVWSFISAGDEFCLAIMQGTTTDTLYAWGDNSYGQLGVGCCDDADEPLDVVLP